MLLHITTLLHPGQTRRRFNKKGALRPPLQGCALLYNNSINTNHLPIQLLFEYIVIQFFFPF